MVRHDHRPARRRELVRFRGGLEEAGADGFNLGYALMHESFADFVDLVVPELQRPGVYKEEYRPGTLREKLFPTLGAKLPASHPAAAFRHASAEAPD
jgi:hypothetical protein